MNTEHVQELRDFLAEVPASGFDMGSWMRFKLGSKAARESFFLRPKTVVENKGACGTICCIAGWTVIYSASKDEHQPVIEDLRLMDTQTEAGLFLGLTPQEASALFVWGPWGSEQDTPATERSGGGSSMGSGERGKAAILKQLDYMILTGSI